MSDILLFGATGVVGRLTAAYLSDHAVTLAGRDAAALTALRDEVNPAWEIATGDALSAEDMAALAARAKVVISCVGPYSRLGWEMVNACAESGTDYVDLCGEVPFIRRVIDTHHDTTSARIVHSCGFDSVPSDMGAFALREHAAEELETVTMVVEKLKGGLSTGTLDSMLEVSAQARADKDVARNLHNPYSLSPVPSAEPRLADARDFHVTQLDDGRWTGPFFMAMFNTRIVRRSNSLRGERFTYHERWATRGRLSAYALAGVTAALFAAAKQPLLRRLIPGPGDGHFRFTHEGLGVSGERYSCTVAADGDPGYEVTAMMLAEAALTLLEHPGEGGVLTPSTALGNPYLERLRAGGMSFTFS
ncbi:MAG: saccharopine dehydrogenase NADP-binding domain-containing protein [Corynebacterium sp.]|uniref:saccharopine dehydrogenase family protein n=1 Tax=Corynebacterium sp. TaxID=1720 RepID=UPI0026E0E209|nr:saccharopine dehydrogenase NADP-binding domain-containing protein [Corynebacterium sp.]MDO5670581.1 saccharopine dehydrogenase NADP-binding domain-containing protein [Corynebacterium sp.]